MTEATRVIAAEALAWASETDRSIGEIHLVGFDTESAEAFADGLRRAEAG